MFKRWFSSLAGRDNSQSEPPAPVAPEIMGLRLGGSFELNDLWLRLIEPELTFEGASRTHLIQAVGMVQLDETSTVLRYYTDDDAFIRVFLDGGITENHIADFKLWYFYDTTGITGDSDWEDLINRGVSLPELEVERNTFLRAWGGATDPSPPMAWTEKTYSETGQISTTDQFSMMYQREYAPGKYEYAMKVAEEKLVRGHLDRCCVISTGVDITSEDIYIVG